MRDTLYRWLYDHYREHVEGDTINVDSLERALAEAFDGRPNPNLHKFVIDFCLDVQALTQKSIAQPNAAPGDK